MAIICRMLWQKIWCRWFSHAFPPGGAFPEKPLMRTQDTGLVEDDAATRDQVKIMQLEITQMLCGAIWFNTDLLYWAP